MKTQEVTSFFSDCGPDEPSTDKIYLKQKPFTDRDTSKNSTTPSRKGEEKNGVCTFTQLCRYINVCYIARREHAHRNVSFEVAHRLNYFRHGR